MDEDTAFHLRSFMNDIFRLMQRVKTDTNEPRTLIGSGDLLLAREMLKIIPEDVRPYYPAWFRDVKIELVADEQSIGLANEQIDKDKEKV